MSKSRSTKIATACSAIEADLSKPWRTATLARAAGMAQHHFQRQFAAATGETVAGYIRSRRLERAAIALHDTRDRVIDIALDTGFQTHAALTRAFTAHFGLSPKEFRQNGLPSERQGLPPRPYLRPLSSRTLTATCDLVEVPAQWLCWRRTRGVKDGRFFGDIAAIHRSFEELRAEIGDRPAILATALPEGPKAFEDPDATAFYGALCLNRFDLAWSSSWRQLPSGMYAVFPHYGPLATLYLSWHRSVRAGFNQLGATFRAAWMFETYLSSNPQASDTELSALIYLPVEKSTVGKAHITTDR